MIKWPPEWSPEKGWPSTNREKCSVMGECREWVALSANLNAKYGFRVTRLISEIGGPNWKNFLGKPTLTEEIILADADAFHEINHEWPRHGDKRPVPNKPQETWYAYQSALWVGGRGLPGGTSLRRLLAKCRGAYHPRLQPILTEETILVDAYAFREIHGQWPRTHDRRSVPGKPHASWTAYNTALGMGGRGLPAGSSLPRLFSKHRGLTEEILLADADAFREIHGAWPTTRDPRPVPKKAWESWVRYDRDLRMGLRGLPAGGSLPRLLAKHRGYRNIHGRSELTEEIILTDADAFHEIHGGWPTTKDTRAVPGKPHETWDGYNAALSSGSRGLSSGSSIARLLAKRRGAKNIQAMPNLNLHVILSDAGAFYRIHGEWPKYTEKRPVPGKPNETWRTYDSALRRGYRGLPGGSSLRRLFASQGRVA